MTDTEVTSTRQAAGTVSVKVFRLGWTGAALGWTYIVVALMLLLQSGYPPSGVGLVVVAFLAVIALAAIFGFLVLAMVTGT